MEVNHGPFLVDNNLLLSAISLRDWSQGGAYVNNLLAGQITTGHPQMRETPYHPPHTTALAGITKVKGADSRFYNNIFISNGKPAVAIKNKPVTKGQPQLAGFGLCVYDSDELPLHTGGNLNYHSARPYTNEVKPLVVSEYDPQVKIVAEDGQTFIQFNFGPELDQATTVTVTSALLGKARIPDLPFEAADGSPLKIDRDFFGNPRNEARPTQTASTGFHFEKCGLEAQVLLQSIHLNSHFLTTHLEPSQWSVIRLSIALTLSVNAIVNCNHFTQLWESHEQTPSCCTAN